LLAVGGATYTYVPTRRLLLLIERQWSR
jgi:hypothetical protein